jgi:sugar lactone lactonase YvrE
VVASIATGTGTLGGTTTVAAVSGVATFTDLGILGLGNFTLRFTPASLTAVDSSSFALEAAPVATKVAITRAAVGTQRRTAFTTQPQISIQYANNDIVTASSAVVTASISSGGTLIGTTTATASSGVATFSNLGVDGTIGSTYTITYTAVDLTVATATVTLIGTTCDGATFNCQVGDTGPGGGKIFYVAPTTFTQLGATGFMCSTACKYLEAAPTSGTGAWTDEFYRWSGNIDTLIGTTGTAIGTGYKNTLAIVAQSNTSDRAATVSRGYSGPNSLRDWFLPSKDELNELYMQKAFVGSFQENYYWSSSESDATSSFDQNFLGGSQGTTLKDGEDYVRPIRAFGTAPTTISIANVVIPAPVLGATPVDSITSNGQYTTAITWSGSPTTFAASTAYTATVTITPVAGYTLAGVGNGFFTVNGNAANGVINSTNIETTGVAPYAVAADGQGNIYLANTFAGNVTKITPIGVTSILGTTTRGITGGRGTPVAITVDPDGNVYTADQGSGNVTKLTPQGVSANLMTGEGNPKSIIYAAGFIYTTYLDNDAVFVAGTQGGYTRINVANPWGITIDAAGNIYTSDTVSNNVIKTTPAGLSSTIFGTTGSQPVAITIDSAGNIYTANYSSNNVTKITPGGVSSILGTTSEGPNAITIDAAGNIYTANYSSNNVTKITPQGVSSTYGTTGNWPTGITVDSEGNIYTANSGSNNVTRFSGTNSGVFTYRFPTTAAPVVVPPAPTPPAPTPPVVVAVAPTPVPYLKTLTTPKLRLSSGKLLCTPGTYNAGYTLDGVIQGSTTTLFTPSSFTYNLLINGISQTSLAVTSSSTSHSWTMPASTSGALITCSVTVTANGITNTDKSGDNTSGASSALTTQSAAIATANATYSAALSANTKAYQKALVDNRTQWRSTTEKIRTDYYAERNRINSLLSTKATRALASAALKAYTAALKKSAADYKASGPAALAAKDVADKAALDAKTTAIAKANAAYGTAIESIGYGVLIP